MTDKPHVQPLSPSAPDLNPFPPTAVARLGGEHEPWSIETAALKAARVQLRQYLTDFEANVDAPKRAPAKGVILAVIGDYGTGKTHLAQELLWQIGSLRSPLIHSFYLDAPSDTFLALYRHRFISKLRENETDLLCCLDEYYCDVVADALASSVAAADLVSQLRERRASPDHVVRTLGLMESMLASTLADRLRIVTERKDFGTALWLFRRPEFRPSVWEWLAGSPPDALLKERGIAKQIATDAAALEAIGVLAFIFGHQNHRFILFIDEIEKVLSQEGARPGSAAVLAFKKLMEACGKSRALLVLVGLPEFLEALPRDAQQRISAVVRPSSLTASEIGHYICESNRRAGYAEEIRPFTADTIDYLAEVAGGNARRVVRLCYHAFAAAADTGSGVVTRAMIREIAREQFELTSDEDVADDVMRVIESRGWLFERDKEIGLKGNRTQVDFWMPQGKDGVGTALLLSRSILQDADADALIARAKAIAKSDETGPKVGVVLVVVGYLSDSLAPQLAAAFTRIVPYRLRGFAEDLESVLGGIRIRLEERGRVNALGVVQERVDEIRRQGSHVQEMLRESLARGITRSDLHAAVSSGLRSFFGQLATADNSESGRFPRVGAVFDDIQRRLDSPIALEEIFDSAFGFIASPRGRISRKELMTRSRRRHRVAVDRFLSSRGIAGIFVIGAALRSFRRGVVSALDQLTSLRGDSDEELIMPIIKDMCRAFEELVTDTRWDEIQSDTATFLRVLNRDDSASPMEISAIDDLQDAVKRVPSDVYQAVREELLAWTRRER